MSDSVKQHIFVVDDEQSVCEAISEVLEDISVEVTCFVSALECLRMLPSQRCDLLVTDLKMPKINGIELITKIKQFKPLLPIIVVTGYGDIPTAIKAIKAGAADFIEKPLHKESFLDKVEAALQESTNKNRSNRLLSERELTVLKLVLEGKTNKEIARLLSRSPRTIEVHRSHIMHKLGVCSLVDLIKRAASIGLIDQTISLNYSQDS